LSQRLTTTTAPQPPVVADGIQLLAASNVSTLQISTALPLNAG
jgi:hypothetical protein